MRTKKRSVLFVPATNVKALAKAPTLAADAVIIDLEDAVSPIEKESARAAALRALALPKWKAPLRAVRINALDSPWGESDVLALAPARLDALVIPKAQNTTMLRQIRRLMARSATVPGRPSPALWAMVETPNGVLNMEDMAANAAELGLSTFIAGTNDLAKELKCDGRGQNREALMAHLSRLVLTARAFGLDVLDGVYNAFDDMAGFTHEAKQGRRLGFDGKSLIHPAQIDTANIVFGPGDEEIKQAKAIIRAFGLKKNADKGAINMEGEMVERLHLQEAQVLLDSLPSRTAKPRTPKEKKKI